MPSHEDSDRCQDCGFGWKRRSAMDHKEMPPNGSAAAGCTRSQLHDIPSHLPHLHERHEYHETCLRSASVCPASTRVSLGGCEEMNAGSASSQPSYLLMHRCQSRHHGLAIRYARHNARYCLELLTLRLRFVSQVKFSYTSLFS
jgi:hypothetical protein